MNSNSEISFNSLGFDLSNTIEPHFVSWKEIESVFVYKKDLFTVDLICMAIGIESGQSVYLDEDMSGWKNFIDRLPDYLPGCLSFPDWFTVVAFPAFEAKPTRIFSRGDQKKVD